MSDLASDYDYELPERLIASRPLAQRDASRLMVIDRASGRVMHHRFSEIGAFFDPGDLLVLNDTRVIPARAHSDDDRVEFLFLEPLGERRWLTLVKPGRRMRVGDSTKVEGVKIEVVGIAEGGAREVIVHGRLDLDRVGEIPLPPYFNRAPDENDRTRYQTVYAKADGSVAAPTAGLHFTPELLSQLPHTFLTLHVGAGTFQPVKSERISEHVMHEERFAISETAAGRIAEANRIVAVGTTSARVLESQPVDRVVPGPGRTAIFIHPPYQFKHVDKLITNFHLPRSTLLMLVSAFAGRELVLDAYAEAVREGYRFYSYGDAMLLL